MAMRRRAESESEIESLYADAVALASERRYDEAIRLFRRMLRRIAYAAVMRPALERQELNTAAKLPSLLRDAHVGLGNCYVEKGMLREAMAELSAGVEQDLTDAEALGRLAEVHVRMGQLSAAANLLERASTVDSSAVAVRIAQCHYWIAAKDYDKALEVCLDVIPVLAPNDIHYAEFVSEFLAHGQPDAALRVSQAAVHAVPSDMRRWLHLARVQYSLGRLTEARDTLEESAGLFPDAVDVLQPLAQTLLALGDIERADQVCTRLRALAPKSPSVLMFSAAAAQQLEKLGEAVHYAAALVRASPLDPYAHFQLGALQQQTGDFASAMQRYSIALSLASFADAELVRALNEAIQRLDMIQIQQVVTLAAENVIFRTRLRRNCQRTLDEHGFRVTDAALAMLQSVDVSDLLQLSSRSDPRVSH